MSETAGVSTEVKADIKIVTSIGELSGILYGQPDKPVILALHGWLDNAASFHLLAPLLEDYSVLALDLPGHGHSAWLGDGASYLIWSYVPPILEAIQNYSLLNEQPFYILGHSLGTGVAMLVASVIPEKIKAYIALDALGPITTPAHRAAAQLKQSLLAAPKTSSLYNSVSEALAVRMRATADVPEAALLQIVERNLSKQGHRWQWSTDPNLRLPSIVRFTEEQLQSVMKTLTMPVLAIQAQQGMASTMFFEQRLEHIPNGSLAIIAGKHHFHLETASVGKIAQRIKEFLTHD